MSIEVSKPAGDFSTPEEYEQALLALKEKLDAYYAGSGDSRMIEQEATLVLSRREKFPEVFERHRDIEPMLGDMLAERIRTKVFRPGPFPKGS